MRWAAAHPSAAEEAGVGAGHVPTHMQQVFLLEVDAVVLHPRVVADHHLGHRGDEQILFLVAGYVMLDELSLGVVLKHHQYALTAHRRLRFGSGYVENVNRLVQRLVARHMNQHAIGRQGIAERAADDELSAG